MKKDKHLKNTPALDKARVLELLAEKPGATKRDLAKALGLKGSDRIHLKRILKELEGDGIVTGKPRSGLTRRGELPEIGVIEVIGIDEDGELLAKPLTWESNEEPPRIYVSPPKTGAPATGARLLAHLDRRGDAYEARIIRPLESEAPTELLGVLRESPDGGFRLMPVDRKVRTEYALDKKDVGEARHNELVIAEPLPGRIQGFQRVKVRERIGSMQSPRTISLIAIHDHDIPTEFPKAVVDAALAARTIDSGAEIAKGRTDLRAIPLVTIDPPDARDHDDAVWAGPDDDPANKGGHVVLVAIADVARYVTPGSELDREAYKRGNSAYFPDRVVPMLPEELSADLCSLKEAVDRPCLVARMVFDARGHKRGHRFLRGVMRSAARLTYAEAQAAFDGNAAAHISAEAKATLAQLWAAYRALTVAREVRDPLDLDLPERRVILGPDGHVASIAYRERLESMKLIEEFMVLANVAAAESLEQAKTPLIYRVHDRPSREKLFAFGDFLRTLNIAFAKGQVLQPGIFNRILAGGKGKPHEAVLNDIVLRTQAQAIYDPANIGHFGLNLARYAHFTSPIRRYADLIVHRALIRAFELGEDGLTNGDIAQLKETAEHITATERRAMAAERDSTDRYVAAFMSDRVGAHFAARITGVTRFGLFVRLAESGAEGLLPVRSLGGEFFRHDERAQALVGDRSRQTWRLGDSLEVTLEEAAPVTGGLKFALAGVTAAPSRGRKPRPGSPKKARFQPKKR